MKTWFYRQIIVPDTTFGGNPRRVQKKAQCVFVVIREEDGLEVAFEDGEGGCILGVRGGFANVKDDEGAFGKSMLDIVREGKYREYVVKRGDTLGGIAYGNGITIRQLKELNGLSGDLPCLGQVLKIPIQNSGTRNLSECSQESMTLESEQDGCQLIEYIVQSGDYLAKISKKLNVSISDLRRMNPVLKHDVVRVGQVLKVPKSCKRQ